MQKSNLHSFGSHCIKNVKKMCPRKNGAKIIQVMGYTIPTFHEGKQSYVDFYAIDPETKEPRRKKYIIKGETKRLRKLNAQEVIARLTAKLNKGWNPWLLAKNEKSLTPLADILDNYLRSLRHTHREKSIHNYSSRTSIFKQYLRTLPNPDLFALHFDKSLVTDFLDWLETERDINPRTRNNYRGWLSSLAQYMVEKAYIEANPVTAVRKLRQPPKSRTAITPDRLRQLYSYLRQHDPDFLLAVMLEYYCFIRPNELRQIRLADISVKDQSVFIAAEISKNKHNGKVALNPAIINLMAERGYFNHPSGHYLFGKNFRPSPEPVKSDAFNKQFARIRKILHWPDTIKFYSLKDSGIRDLAEAQGIVTARDQARHSDISTTNIYLGPEALIVPERAKNFTGHLHDNL